MSSSFSANQYDGAFKPQRLQNWCQPKQYNKVSRALSGSTMFVADNRGHLLPGMGKRGSAWPNFKGTWDLPARIPAQRINPTSRSVEGLKRLKAWGLDPQHTSNSEPQSGKRNTDALQDAGKQNTKGVQQDGAVSASLPPSVAEVRPASHSRPISADRRTGNQSQDTQTAEVSSVSLPAEDRQNAGDTVTSRPESQRAMSALKPMTREGETARHNTSPVSALTPK
ncbi:protein Flattop isoform X1 [Phyllopteryx taeniolatus]|uniref:protein Flattop isoform X1 n=1 Tax=Phyllopteryx taeniolatus TaxID=161469 RepID=UPI002AD2D64E|nr:protein Flattop isoform X1 [Phyllopteryx taeniolatus]